MLLFPHHVGVPSPLAFLPAIDTPLGVLELGVQVGGAPVDPAGSYRMGSAARLVWPQEAGRVELLLTPYPLPDAGPADRAGVVCWAAILRLYAERPLRDLVFTCRWAAGATWTVAEGMASGEYLEAQRWTDGTQVVTVGTADAAALYTEAHGEGLLPPRWRERLREEELEARDLVHYARAGFRLHVPDLDTGERAQLHYLVAWGPAHEEEILTWLAVGATPGEIAAHLDTAAV